VSFRFLCLLLCSLVPAERALAAFDELELCSSRFIAFFASEGTVTDLAAVKPGEQIVTRQDGQVTFLGVSADGRSMRVEIPGRGQVNSFFVPPVLLARPGTPAARELVRIRAEKALDSNGYNPQGVATLFALDTIYRVTGIRVRNSSKPAAIPAEWARILAETHRELGIEDARPAAEVFREWLAMIVQHTGNRTPPPVLNAQGRDVTIERVAVFARKVRDQTGRDLVQEAVGNPNVGSGRATDWPRLGHQFDPRGVSSNSAARPGLVGGNTVSVPRDIDNYYRHWLAQNGVDALTMTATEVPAGIGGPVPVALGSFVPIGARGHAESPLSRELVALDETPTVEHAGKMVAAYREGLSHATDWGTVDFVVPIPSHTGAEDTSAVLAQAVSRAFNRGYASNILVRNPQHSNVNQTSVRGDHNRYAAARNAYMIDPAQAASIRGKVVLIVDDILHSGATADDAARAIAQAGGIPRILVFARTARHQ
jgi:adenine/guanine phosphoribosyltransferase-like PRPP-binding protein